MMKAALYCTVFANISMVGAGKPAPTGSGHWLWLRRRLTMSGRRRLARAYPPRDYRPNRHPSDPTKAMLSGGLIRARPGCLDQAVTAASSRT